MKKNNNVAAVLAVNAVVLGVIALNAYKPKLEKYARVYVENKKSKNKPNYKIEQRKVLSLAEKELPKPETLIKEAVTSCDLMAIKDEKIVNKEIHDLLLDKFNNLPNVVNGTAYAAIPMKNTPSIELIYPSFSPRLEALTTIGEAITVPPLGETLTDTLGEELKKPETKKFIIKLALAITLNAIGFASIATVANNVTINKEVIESTMEDIEDFFVDTYDVVVTLNNHEEIVERKIDRIMATDEDASIKLVNIYNLDEPTREEKISSIIGLEDVDYLTKFNFFLNPNYFALTEGIDLIINSNLATFTQVADYIMDIPELSQDEKLNIIINSDLTGYTRIFDYILTNEKINEPERLGYVLHSGLAEYDELFDYFMKKDYTNYDKIWTIMQIEDVSFNQVFDDLLNDGRISEDEIITSLMKSDLVSFEKLFNCILKIENITPEKICDYILYFNNYYNTGYNTMDTKGLVDYTLNIKALSETDKTECFWSLLDGQELLDKEAFIQNYFNVDVKGYLNIYISSIRSKEEIPEKTQILIDLYQKINAEKREFIITNYETTENQLKEVIAGCAAEAYKDYDDLYGVINTIYNRITHPWYHKKGINPYLQFIAPSQFSVYTFKTYLNYLYPKDIFHEDQYIKAEQAVLDMLYSGETIHNYVEFRSWGTTDFSNNYIVKHGNRYGNYLSDESRIDLEFVTTTPKELTLAKK